MCSPRLLAALTGLAISALPTASALAACPPPAAYQNQTSVTDQGVFVSFAADKQTYSAGQAIEFYLSFENIGSETIHIPSPYSPEFKILILPDTCLTPDQPGCDDYGTTRFRLPEGVFHFSPGILLDPGECYVVPSLQTTWSNQTSSSFPPAVGGYRVFGGLPGTGGEFSVPAGGAELTFTVSSSSGVPVEDPPGKAIPKTWGAIKALYR